MGVVIMKSIISSYLGANRPILENTTHSLPEEPSQKLGLIHALPNEIILTVFGKCKTALPALASSNKLWSQITKTKEFYTAMFSPAFASLCFGKEDLNTHFGMDLGPDKVPRLRLKDYGDVEKGLCLLTYFPKEIPIEDKDGVKIVVPPRAEIIGELVKAPKSGNPTSFDPNSCSVAFYEEREVKGGEWTLTYKKPIGHDMTFSKQVALAKEQGDGTDVAELDRTIYAIFMHYVKTGERCFTMDSKEADYYIRFKEGVSRCKIICGFGLSGLNVYCYYDSEYYNIGVAVQRKSAYA